MPVRTHGTPRMMRDARPQSSRTERAADIEVVSGAQKNPAGAADPHGARTVAAQHQHIGARFGGDGAGVAYFFAADHVALSSKPSYTAVPFIAVGLSTVPL